MNKKKFHIITIGCQMNKSDSERLAAFLESQAMTKSRSYRTANLVVINTCGVRQMAEDRAYGLVARIKRDNPSAQIVIIGCLSRRPDVQKRLSGKVDLFLPTNEMLSLPDFLAGTKLSSSFDRLEKLRIKKGEEYLNITPKYGSRFSAFVPIGNGCNNFCSYCVVPYARGREVYRPAAAIIKEVAGLIAQGYKEIILVAQNVNSYQSHSYDFPKLLKRLAKIPGHFWIRFASSHPKDMSPELVQVIGSEPKICPHLHLAVQSGDDRILKAMNRKYTTAHYRRLIKMVRTARPGIAITTDIIVGFPGETKEQFQNTAKLFKDINFDLAYIAQYSPRPGTVSAKMEDNVSREEKKRRWEKLNDMLTASAFKNNRAYLGREVEVLIEGKNRRGGYYGKTGSYKNVSITGGSRKNLTGQLARIMITKAMAFGLEGELIG